MSEHNEDRVEDLDLPASESENVKGGAIYQKRQGDVDYIEKVDPYVRPSFDLKSQKVQG